MKVSVFELVMCDGSSGRLAISYVPEGERASVESLFKKDVKVRNVNWCMNAWISYDIGGPVRVDWKSGDGQWVAEPIMVGIR